MIKIEYRRIFRLGAASYRLRQWMVSTAPEEWTNSTAQHEGEAASPKRRDTAPLEMKHTPPKGREKTAPFPNHQEDISAPPNGSDQPPTGNPD